MDPELIAKDSDWVDTISFRHQACDIFASRSIFLKTINTPPIGIARSLLVVFATSP